MKMPKAKLRDLQKQWYKILEDSGFKDIETMIGGELVLKQFAAHNLWNVDPFDREMDEEYFTILFHKVNDEDTSYRNEADKIIMQQHSSGAKIKEIIHVLNKHGEKRCRRAIRVIIRKYEMEWGLRNYTDRQLNIYKKKTL